jgi:hypothetical protein
MIKFLSKNINLIIKKEDYINFNECCDEVEIKFYAINSYGNRTVFSRKANIDLFIGLYLLIDGKWIKI